MTSLKSKTFGYEISIARFKSVFDMSNNLSNVELQCVRISELGKIIWDELS